MSCFIFIKDTSFFHLCFRVGNTKIRVNIRLFLMVNCALDFRLSRVAEAQEHIWVFGEAADILMSLSGICFCWPLRSSVMSHILFTDVDWGWGHLLIAPLLSWRYSKVKIYVVPSSGTTVQCSMWVGFLSPARKRSRVRIKVYFLPSTGYFSAPGSEYIVKQTIVNCGPLCIYNLKIFFISLADLLKAFFFLLMQCLGLVPKGELYTAELRLLS